MIAADIRAPWRAPLVVLGFASLFVGIAAGLARFGWMVPVRDMAAAHGALMVCGFFGTVISLERAVALGRRWAYAGPLASGTAALGLMAGASAAVVSALWVIAAAMLLVASLLVYYRQQALFTLTLALGAASWTFGNVLWWAGYAVYDIVPWWLAFLVLTIAGERLELSRLLPPSVLARRVFAVLVAALLGSIALSLPARPAGTVALGIVLVALASWLMRQDIARRTVRNKGLTRFIAVCLLSGYFWLAAGGAWMAASGGLAFAGPAYDGALHAVLLGFVFSMVFGHAPIILPAVLRIVVPYHPYFYVPLALLHISLFVRLAGDLTASPAWRAWGGALNGVALLAFVLGTACAAIRGARGASLTSSRRNVA